MNTLEGGGSGGGGGEADKPERTVDTSGGGEIATPDFTDLHAATAPATTPGEPPAVASTTRSPVEATSATSPRTRGAVHPGAPVIRPAVSRPTRAGTSNSRRLQDGGGEIATPDFTDFGGDGTGDGTGGTSGGGFDHTLPGGGEIRGGRVRRRSTAERGAVPAELMALPARFSPEQRARAVGRLESKLSAAKFVAPTEVMARPTRFTPEQRARAETRLESKLSAAKFVAPTEDMARPARFSPEQRARAETRLESKLSAAIGHPVDLREGDYVVLPSGFPALTERGNFPAQFTGEERDVAGQYYDLFWNSTTVDKSDREVLDGLVGSGGFLSKKTEHNILNESRHIQQQYNFEPEVENVLEGISKSPAVVLFPGTRSKTLRHFGAAFLGRGPAALVGSAYATPVLVDTGVETAQHANGLYERNLQALGSGSPSAIRSAREEDTATAGAVTSVLGAVVRGQYKALREDPAGYLGEAAFGAVVSLGAGKALGLGGRALVDRYRTFGGAEVPLEELTQARVLKGEAKVPGAEDASLYRQNPAAAVRSQAGDYTPPVVEEHFAAAGADEGTVLKKALGVEPEGGGPRGFQSAPAELEGSFAYETPGSFFGPEVSPHFFRAGERSRIGLRPGLPDFGGRPTGVLARVEVRNARARTLGGFNREIMENVGETTAFTKPAGVGKAGEIEAVVPPGATFRPTTTGLRSRVAGRIGLGSEFYTEFGGRRIPLRTVVPEEGAAADVAAGEFGAGRPLEAYVRPYREAVDRPAPLTPYPSAATGGFESSVGADRKYDVAGYSTPASSFTGLEPALKSRIGDVSARTDELLSERVAVSSGERSTARARDRSFVSVSAPSVGSRAQERVPPRELPPAPPSRAPPNRPPRRDRFPRLELVPPSRAPPNRPPRRDRFPRLELFPPSRGPPKRPREPGVPTRGGGYGESYVPPPPPTYGYGRDRDFDDGFKSSPIDEFPSVVDKDETLLAPGYFAEFLTAFAKGAGPRAAPTQGELAAFAGGGAGLAGELPTAALLEGGADIEAAEELFTFSGGDDGGLLL